MEFKKPNRYDKGRPRVIVPQRGDSTPIAPPSVSNQAPHTKGKGLHFGSLPSRKVLLSRARRFLFSKKGIVTGVILVIVICLITVGTVARQQQVVKTKGGSIDPNQLIENLEYQTVLPGGKTITELGGWQRVSPDKNDPVYAYVDKIGDVSISVSQQPLPNSFKNDTGEKVAELAKSYNATNKISAGNTTVYIGTSTKGPQSTIFTRNGLLILIKSQKNIDDKAWIAYIESLN